MGSEITSLNWEGHDVPLAAYYRLKVIIRSLEDARKRGPEFMAQYYAMAHEMLAVNQDHES